MITLLTLVAFISGPSFADEPKKVSVSGQCTAEVTPDRRSVNFVVEKLDKDAASAIRKATELHEQLRAELLKLKVKDLVLSSSEYNVSERKEWENNKNVSKGFSARLGLKAVTPAISELGKLLAMAGKLGVTETNNLTTDVSEAKWMDEKKKCLDQAAKNAEEKAQSLVKSLHAKLGHVFQITERDSGNSEPVRPMYMQRAMQKTEMADAPQATIEAAKQTLVQTVDVTFLIE